MRRAFILGCVLWALPLDAKDVLRQISWANVELPTPVTLTVDGDVHFRSSSPDGSAVTLVEIEAPGISKNRYSLSGRVRYEAVGGEGYLEMWSDFGAQGKYFTRTLGESGLLQKLSGSSGMRDFALFFDASGASAPPKRLTMNIVLPARGQVWVSALTLTEYQDDEWPEGASTIGLGSASTVGLWGGLAGSLLGISGALFGWLGGRGKAKGFVLSGLRTMLVAGFFALALGVVSMARGAGTETTFTLLLLGTIAVVAPLSALTALKKRYEEIELRRMQALDA